MSIGRPAASAEARQTIHRVMVVVLALGLVLPLPQPALAQGPSHSVPAAAPIVALSIPDEGGLAAAAAAQLDERPPLPDELPTFEALRDDAKALLDSMPARDWDIDALADSLDYDPDRAFAFVRDSIGLDPYPGVLRGAEGTLAARSGSPADRALLLGALLDAMQVPYRFASADLDDVSAGAIVDRSFVTPTDPLPTLGLDATPAFAPDDIEARAARDYAQLRLALGDRVVGEGVATADASRVAAMDAIRPHVWVQRRLGSEWQDLDPTMPTSAAGDALVPANSTLDALPDELAHRVRIRLEEERLDGQTLATTPLLEYEASAWDAADSELFLLFAPLSDRLGGTISELLTGDIQWYPMLMVDGVRQQGQSFRIGSAGTDVFGSPDDPGSPLTAVRLVVDTSSPDGTSRHVERALLDRVPPDARASGLVTEAGLGPMPQDDGIPRFLLNVRHVMVSTGGANVRDYALQRYLATDYAGSTLIDATLAEPPSAYDAVWPIAATDQGLVVASETAVVSSLADDSGARAFVGSPRVFLTTAGRDPTRPDALAFVTDLAIDGVNVSPGDDPASGARLQLWYGALQTALESQLAVRRAALIEPEARVLIGASLGGSGDLRIVDPADPPDAASPALLADLASGSVVLRWDGDETTHRWWVIDPRDGATRSMVDPGLGGAMPAGPPVVGSRTADSSYSHGKGPRLPPRPPMQPQAPGGPRGGCTGGNEDTAIMCHVSLPGGIALSFNLLPVIVLTAEAAAFALIAWRVATG